MSRRRRVQLQTEEPKALRACITTAPQAAPELASQDSPAQEALICWVCWVYGEEEGVDA